MGRARFKVVGLRRRWVPALALLGGLASGQRTAHPQAQAAIPAAWLREYQVAPGCPDAATFGAWVAERQSQPTVPARATVQLRVSITRDSALAFSGILDVADGAEVTRRIVAGKDCVEVALALGLIAAIALEPDTRRDAQRLPADTDTAVTSVPPERVPAPAPSTAGTARAPTSAGVALGAFALGLAHGAAAPDRALGAGLAFALEWRSAAVWQPALSLGGFRVASEERSFAGGAARARFVLSAAQGLMCPWRWPAQGRWGLRPCLELELGWLQGSSSGRALIDPTTRGGLWASGALAARADLDPWGPLRISLLGSLMIPLTRHDFSFSPNETLVFRVPALSWQAAIFMGALF
jgi:hypothetical protein